MGIFLILLSITLVIFLVFKGVPVFYSAVLASMFCLLTAALFTGAGADTGMVNYLINGMGSMAVILPKIAPKPYTKTGGSAICRE